VIDDPTPTSLAVSSEVHAKKTAHEARNNIPKTSIAKIQAFIGIIAITLGNIVGFISNIDKLRQFASKVLGTEWAYRFHTDIVYGACILLLVGYGSLTYWLYWNFIANRARWTKAAFYAAALFAVGSMVLGSWLIFRPIDYLPLVKKQATDYVQVVLSQETVGGRYDGGFRFSQGNISDDTQVWTTAQSLVALLQLPSALVDRHQEIRRAFNYIERLRLDDSQVGSAACPGSSGGGWGYLEGFRWGVTEVDAWVALAYLNSLRPANVSAIWAESEIPGTVAKVQEIIKLLIDRQHKDGGWSPIEKTADPRHERTYSAIMATWALAEALKNGEVLRGHEADYLPALRLAAKWLLASYSTSSEGFSGWWPNPSNRNPVGSYPALQAQTLFVLSVAKASDSSIGADSRYTEALQNFIRLMTDGNDKFEPLRTRKLSDNERAHDSDRYLEGRLETVEQYTFLWYPWTIALGATLEHDALLEEPDRERLRTLIASLLERSHEVDGFVRNDEVIYPTDEVLFAEGYYLSRNRQTLKDK
jgi:hypothetical protein